eukprot:scaffold85196_cov26-Tisochrysis_lutea.AAC.2
MHRNPSRRRSSCAPASRPSSSAMLLAICAISARRLETTLSIVDADRLALSLISSTATTPSTCVESTSSPVSGPKRISSS